MSVRATMDTPSPLLPEGAQAQTQAARQAFLNAEANRAAITQLQPALAQAIQAVPSQPVEWVYGRDGSLTALLDGVWLSGTSLPGRVAHGFLKSMSIKGSVACFLYPTHAAQLRTALAMLDRTQALVAVVPQPLVLSLLLHCEDFTEAIEAHRLWFVCGEDWNRQMDELFTQHPGLPLPLQFIRLPKINEALVNAMIPAAQHVFAELACKRATLVEQTKHDAASAQRPSTSCRLCVLAPSQFQLWEDAGAVLATTLVGGRSSCSESVELLMVDPHDPLYASPVAMATAANESDAVVSANTARCDIPNVVALSRPWITWVTVPRIPVRDPAALRDALALADPAWQKLAVDAGWPADRLVVAGWPAEVRGATSECDAATLVIAADTRMLEPPQDVKDLSSRRLLWEMVADELRSDPFVLGNDPDRYLRSRMERQHVSENGFDRVAFIESVVVPAYQQGLARALLAGNLPVRLFGKGWHGIDDLRAHAGGPILSRAHLRQVLSSAKAIVHVWPVRHAHPIDSMGLPVIARRGLRREPFLRDARLAIQGQPPATPYAAPQIGLGIIRSLL